MLNNEYLRRTANAVDGGDTPEGARILNNEYLRRIADGIYDLVDASGQATDPVDVTRLSGVIPAANLPSYVDDVVEGYLHQGTFYEDSLHADEITPEAGKIYVDLSADTSYRWGGSSYVAIGRTLDAASQAEAEAGQDNAKYMTPLRTAQAIDERVTAIPVSTVHEITGM